MHEKSANLENTCRFISSPANLQSLPIESDPPPDDGTTSF